MTARAPAHRRTAHHDHRHAQQGQTLTTTTAAGTATLPFTYQWQDCDAERPALQRHRHGRDTYALTSSDVGHTVQVIVTATDDGGILRRRRRTRRRRRRAAEFAAPEFATASITADDEPVAAYGRRRHRPDGEHHERRLLGLGDAERPSTQAYFEYGLDPKYSGGGPVVYAQSTPAQSVGSDFSNHASRPGRGRRPASQRAVPRAAGRDQQRRHDARTRRHVHHRRGAGARRPDRRQDGQRRPRSAASC